MLNLNPWRALEIAVRFLFQDLVPIIPRYSPDYRQDDETFENDTT